jgi:hypothetical protein
LDKPARREVLSDLQLGAVRFVAGARIDGVGILGVALVVPLQPLGEPAVPLLPSPGNPLAAAQKLAGKVPIANILLGRSRDLARQERDIIGCAVGRSIFVHRALLAPV